ncbi:hypothetical protein GOODEAATRI_029752, partial [Goodea atripinnis]
NNDQLIRSTNLPEERKTAAIKKQQDHLQLVQKERAVYNEMTAGCKKTCYDYQLSIGPSPLSNSLLLTMRIPVLNLSFHSPVLVALSHGALMTEWKMRKRNKLILEEDLQGSCIHLLQTSWIHGLPIEIILDRGPQLYPSQHLIWAEYAHDSHISATTG